MLRSGGVDDENHSRGTRRVPKRCTTQPGGCCKALRHERKYDLRHRCRVIPRAHRRFAGWPGSVPESFTQVIPQPFANLAALPLAALLARAAALRADGHGPLVSYSRKVFIPLTRLCRDVCHYCTFARPPREGERAYLTPDEVLAIANARPPIARLGAT